MTILEKTSIANVVAGLVVLVGIVYGFIQGDTNIVLSIAMAGVGYLFGRATAKK